LFSLTRQLDLPLPASYSYDSCEVHDREGYEDIDRRERDDDREHGGHDDRGRPWTLALVGDLPEVLSLLRGRVDRMTSEALVLGPVDGLVLHVANDRA
jgi:hypothetical protein